MKRVVSSNRHIPIFKSSHKNCPLLNSSKSYRALLYSGYTVHVPITDEPVTFDDPTALYQSVTELQGRVTQIATVQTEILSQLLHVREDLKIILAGSKSTVQTLKDGIPEHPVGDHEGMKVLENWIEDEKNYNILVCYKSTYIFP